MSQAGPWPSDDNTLLTYVNEVWFKSFSQAPYTSIWMIEYLLGQTDLSYEEILKDPGILHETLEDEPLSFDDEAEFKYMSSRPGRCTSFAIQVVRDLEETADERGHRDRFEFDFFELGFHRVARCKKTGIMIDSSSSHGAFILKEGAWETFTGLAKWEWNPSNSRFEKSSTSGSKEVSRCLSREQCMINCLLDVAKGLPDVATRAGILHYFRNASEGPRFFCMMRWDLQNQTLKVGKSPKSTDTEFEDVKFKFDSSGTQETEKECKTTLASFVLFYGAQQFDLVGDQWETCWAPDARLWKAAIKTWGYPHTTADSGKLIPASEYLATVDEDS